MRKGEDAVRVSRATNFWAATAPYACLPVRTLLQINHTCAIAPSLVGEVEHPIMAEDRAKDSEDSIHSALLMRTIRRETQVGRD